MFQSYTATTEVLADRLEKPLLDDRSYRVIRLPNQLEALLIHDPETDKAAAAVDVRAGSLCDELDLPGMAHAVEHMLFLGNEKYPKENEYQQYLAQYAGSHNAFTSQLSTNYFFEMSVAEAKKAEEEANIPNGDTKPKVKPFYGGLDRFAQFFVKPLFLEDSLDRELRAVDSENKKNLQSDVWRLQQLKRSFTNPEHPNCRFSTGNLKTLRDDPVARGVNIRKEFIRFYDEQYSANRMKLVVLGREPLDELQSWTEELFSAVPNKNLKPNHWDAPLYTEKELLIEAFAKPVMETRSMEITFPYPDEDELWQTQPGRYLSHLIGHEGPGSILAMVKGLGWVNGLSAGSRTTSPGSGTFEISISLTPEGLKNYQEIVKIVFQYLSILHKTEPQEWMFKEVRDMSEVDFKFQQKRGASSTASGTAGTMQKPLPRDLLLSGLFTQRQFDAESIRKGTAALNADNFRLTIVTQDELPGELQHEKWYGTEYTERKISPEFHQALKKAINSSSSELPKDLFLPHKNEFIPTRLDVDKKEIESPAKRPKLVKNDGNVRLWFKKDDQFWVPKATYWVRFRNPICGSTARNATMSMVFSDLVDDALSEYAYDAEIAGLDYGFDASTGGISCSVSGFNDKMSVLLEKVLSTACNIDIKDDRFSIVKERLERGFRNKGFTAPYQQIGDYSRWLTSEKGFIAEQYLAELIKLTAADIRAFHPLLLGQMHIEAVAHGNLYLEDALKLTDLTERVLQPKTLPEAQWPIQRSLLLPEGSNYIYNRQLPDPANVNHAIEYVLQIGEMSDRSRRARLMLLDQMCHEPAFDRLRTKEQLGYVVFSGAIRSASTLSFRFIIQSEREPAYLETRIDAFLRAFKIQLAEMDAEAFEAHKASKINERREKIKNLTKETDRYLMHVANEMYHFEEMEEDAQNIEKVTKEEMMQFFDLYVDPESTRRAKTSVWMHARKSAAEAEAEAESQGTKMGSEEVRKSFMDVLSQFMQAVGATEDEEKLDKRFANVDLSQGDQNSILGALKSYLAEDAKLAEQKVQEAMEQAKVVLPNVLMQLGVKLAPVEGAEKAQEEVVPPPACAPVEIKDVHAFKASMPLSRGAQPVRPLSEYMELEGKL